MSQLPVILVLSPESSAMVEARKQVRAAMKIASLMPAWQEVLEGDASLPAKFRGRKGPFLVVANRAVAIGEPEEMAAVIKKQAKARSRWSWLRKPLATGSAVPGILLAFFPKCAGCWAAYFSVFNSMGISLPYMPWLKHVLAASLVVSAVYFYFQAKRRGRWLPFAVQMVGFSLVLLAQYWLKAPAVLWTGVGFVFAGSLLFAMPLSWMLQLEAALGMRREGEAA